MDPTEPDRGLLKRGYQRIEASPRGNYSCRREIRIATDVRGVDDDNR